MLNVTITGGGTVLIQIGDGALVFLSKDRARELASSILAALYPETAAQAEADGVEVKQ